MEQKNLHPLYPFKDSQSGKWGFKNNKDEVVVSPCWWLVYHQFSEGMCPVINDDKKVGFVDETGKLVIPCKYVHALDFRDGLAKVQEGGTFKIGYINHQGETVIPFKYRKGSDFEDGIATVSTADGMWGTINKKDETITPFHFYSPLSFDEGLSPVVNREGKWGYTDMAGNMVIPYKWDFAEFFMQGLATVRNDNGKCGYIDKEGNIVVPCIWKCAIPFGRNRKISYVKDSNGIYFEINLKGNIIRQLDSCPKNI